MGNPATRAWWERYLKHAIPFRGIKTPVLRPIFEQWWADAVAPHDPAFRKEVAFGLFRTGDRGTIRGAWPVRNCATPRSCSPTPNTSAKRSQAPATSMA